jgi:pimeloyl-ACP methyl ester carboxylesterase
VDTATLTEESTSHYADLGWTKVRYNDVGEGEAVVLIHGGGLGAYGWSNFALNIPALAAKYRVLAVDMPGFGKSDPIVITDEPRYTVFVRAIKDLLDHLGIEKAHLVGNSQGGATALEFVVDHPDRTGKVVMMGTANVGVPIMYAPYPGEGLKSVVAVYRNPDFEHFRAMFDLMLYDGSKVPDELLRTRMDGADDTHRVNWLASRGAPRRNLTPQLETVTAPVLLIHGRQDNMAPLELSVTLLGLLKNSQLHAWNECGHWAQYEHADRFNRMVLDFLEHDN